MLNFGIENDKRQENFIFHALTNPLSRFVHIFLYLYFIVCTFFHFYQRRADESDFWRKREREREKKPFRNLKWIPYKRKEHEHEDGNGKNKSTILFKIKVEYVIFSVCLENTLCLKNWGKFCKSKTISDIRDGSVEQYGCVCKYMWRNSIFLFDAVGFIYSIHEFL